MLRYFYCIFTLTILFYSALNEKILGEALPPDPHRSIYSVRQTSSCHFMCLWHVCFLFCKKPRRPYFFCIVPWLEISVFTVDMTLAEAGLWHKCFPVNFAKFLRTAFLQNIPGQLLLYLCDSWFIFYDLPKNNTKHYIRNTGIEN